MLKVKLNKHTNHFTQKKKYNRITASVRITERSSQVPEIDQLME
jgi:hypothetical protein